MKSNVILVVLSAILVSCGVRTSNEATAENSDTITDTVVWDRSYGGADKNYDRELLAMREEVVPKFLTLNFEDDVTGRAMEYNLFVPQAYDSLKNYPLVLFMADASTTGKGVIAPLMQGYGGIIWVTDQSQDKNPCFVLVPSFAGPDNATNDNWEVTVEADMVIRLLHKVVSQYSIDHKRLYTTGQSMGGMLSFYFNVKYPNLFAASIFVGSQWDISVLSTLAYKKFFYIVSVGDPKASVGMNELESLLQKKGVKYGAVEFSAKLPPVDQYRKIQTIIDKGYNINLVRFTEGTVAPNNSDLSKGALEHMYSFDYAYLLKPVRDWLFEQHK